VLPVHTSAKLVNNNCYANFAHELCSALLWKNTCVYRSGSTPKADRRRTTSSQNRNRSGQSVVRCIDMWSRCRRNCRLHCPHYCKSTMCNRCASFAVLFKAGAARSILTGGASWSPIIFLFLPFFSLPLPSFLPFPFSSLISPLTFPAAKRLLVIGGPRVSPLENVLKSRCL